MGQSASKEKFRESVTALVQVDVSADDADFWDELWKMQIKEGRRERPVAVETLK